MHSLVADLERVRGVEPEKGNRYIKFKRAVVWTWIVYELTRLAGEAGRYRVGKTAYFLERGLHLGLFQQHQKKKWGPYDSAAKYHDAEPIAKKKGWLQVKGKASYELGQSVTEIFKYTSRYLKDDVVASKFVEFLSNLSFARLETISTVDMAAVELAGQGKEVSVRSIAEFLNTSAEWKDKLARDNFSDFHIRESLEELKNWKFV